MQVLLLGNGGTTVFVGHPGVAVLYFQVRGPLSWHAQALGTACAQRSSSSCVLRWDANPQVGLGFALPPRENPADVLMDIIAGKVTREGDAM